MTDRIGWVGLGGIGGPMATNVARAGFELTVCDVQPGPVAELKALGAFGAPEPAAVAAACDLLFASLPDLDASWTVASEVFAAANRPAVYVELSTLLPDEMRKLARRASSAGVGFLDAPVSGNVRARNDGTLTVMVGGDGDHFARILPVLEAFGAHIFHLGPVGAGSVAKIANNLIALTQVTAAMEGLLLGIKHGLDVAQLRDVVMTASGACPAVLGVAHQYQTRRYRESDIPNAALRVAVKDLKLAIALANEVHLPARAAQGALASWAAAASSGRAEQEMWSLLDDLEATAD